jgi:hypothetical protein
MIESTLIAERKGGGGGGERERERERETCAGSLRIHSWHRVDSGMHAMPQGS